MMMLMPAFNDSIDRYEGMLVVRSELTSVSQRLLEVAYIGIITGQFDWFKQVH